MSEVMSESEPVSDVFGYVYVRTQVRVRSHDLTRVRVPSPKKSYASVTAFSNFLLCTFGYTFFCVHFDRLRFISIEVMQKISRQELDRLFLNEIRIDRQRTAFFSKNPDRIPTADRIETKKSGQTDTGQHFF